MVEADLAFAPALEQAALVRSTGDPRAIPDISARRINPAWAARGRIESAGRSRYDAAYVRFDHANFSAPSVCDPNHAMVRILRANARALGRPDPAPIVSLGGTDARLWRQRGIPGLVHGPFPRGMAQADEHVEIEEYLHIVRMHVLSAFDYLSG